MDFSRDLKKELVKGLKEKLLPVAQSCIDLPTVNVYDITFRKEKDGKILRIYLSGKISVDDCAAVSKQISAWLDENDIIPFENYTLEVSSLGIDRPLKTYNDFNDIIGKICRIETVKKDDTGRKKYKGRVTKVTNEDVTIYTEEESVHFILRLDNISKAKLEMDLLEE